MRKKYDIKAKGLVDYWNGKSIEMELEKLYNGDYVINLVTYDDSIELVRVGTSEFRKTYYTTYNVNWELCGRFLADSLDGIEKKTIREIIETIQEVFATYFY